MMLSGEVRAASPQGPSQKAKQSKEIGDASYPTLSRCAIDLTERARRGELDPVIGRDRETRRLIEILSAESNESPVVISETGLSASAIADNLAQLMASENPPESLRDKRLFSLSLNTLTDNLTDKNEFTARIQAVLDEVEKSNGRIILVIDQLHQYIGSYAERAVSAALRGAIERRKLQVIGATSLQAYSEYISTDARLTALFQQVRVRDNNNAVNGTDESKESTSNKRDAEGFEGIKISSELASMMQQTRGSNDRIDLILQVDNVASAKLNAVFKGNGARIEARFPRLGGVKINAPIKIVEQLAAIGNIRYLSLDQQIRSLGHISMTTGADAVRQQQPTLLSGAANTVDGTGIGIAVVDSGIDSDHKSFLGRDDRSRIVYSRDFTGENRVDDPYGHGTHVASIAAGNGRIADAKFVGIAPNASIINLRVLNAQGVGTISGTLSALDWLLANHAAYNIRVVNMSLGTPAIDSYKNDPVCRAVRRLVDAGVIVVAAAGNNGKNIAGQKIYGQIHSPGNEPAAITVGASNTFGTDSRADDGVASFSSRGPTRSGWTDAAGVKHYDNVIKPELVAPGNKVIDAESDNNLLVTLHPQLDAGVSQAENRRQMYLSGSSMATPAVAGAAALLLQANPKLTPNMLKAMLMYSAQPLSGFNTFEQGSGQLNIEGAMRLVRLVRTDFGTSKPIGASLLNTVVPPIPQTTLGGYTFSWSQGIILGRRLARGSGLILKYQPVYALGVVISDGVIINNGVVMSDGVVVSDGVVISEGIVISDGIVVSDGVVVSDGIVISDGVVLGSGSLFVRMSTITGDGIVVSDGYFLGDGVVVSDGVVLSDGIVISDSVVVAQSAQLNGDITILDNVVADTGVDCLDY